MGLEAADFNIQLANQLDVGPDRKKNGCWIKAAHLACQNRAEEARPLSEQCQKFAMEAEDTDAEMMAKGWVLLMDQQAGEPEVEQALAALKIELAARGDDGQFYVDQYQSFLDYLNRSAT